jgi:hypothetical protein
MAEGSYNLGTSQEGWMDPDGFDVTNSEDVANAQSMLNRLGYTDGEGAALAEDSMFGKKTEYAWRSYVNNLRDLQGKEQYEFEQRPENTLQESTDPSSMPFTYEDGQLTERGQDRGPSFWKKAAQTIMPGGQAGYWGDVGKGRLATKEGKSRLGYGEGQWAPGKMLSKAWKNRK